jgi:hypothetical protein
MGLCESYTRIILLGIVDVDEMAHTATHAVAPPDLVESFVFRPESPMPRSAVLEEVGSGSAYKRRSD